MKANRRGFLASLLAAPLVGKLLPKAAAPTEFLGRSAAETIPREMYALSWDTFYRYQAKTPDWLEDDSEHLPNGDFYQDLRHSWEMPTLRGFCRVCSGPATHIHGTTCAAHSLRLAV